MRAKPRVLFVAPSAYTLGGLATWLDYLLPGLRDQGWDASLALVSGPRYHLAGNYLEAHPFEHSVRVHCDSGTVFGRTGAVARTLADLRPDIMVTVNVPDAIVGATWARERERLPVRIVMSCHGIQQDLFHDMRRLAPALDAVICTNRLACRLAEQIGGLPEARVFHARYGVVPLEQKMKTDSSGRVTIAWVGRLEQPQKRILDLPEIARLLTNKQPNVGFMVAGTGPEEERLKKKVHDLGVANHFEFLGYVPPERLVPDVYGPADIFLLTSSWETGPIVIWESMSAGTPVVTSRYAGSGREGLLRDGENCLMFEYGDCGAAADQLEQLVNSKGLRQQLQAAGKALIETELNCARSVQVWDRTLRAVLDVPASAGILNIDKLVRGQGRLDRLLGLRGAEVFRRLTRRKGPDSGPAGEWPHTLAGNLIDDAEFWKLAQALDAGKTSPASEELFAGLN